MPMLAPRCRSETDEKCFEALVLPLERFLWARAMQLSRSPQDASDLVQDTLERGWRYFHQFQPGTSIGMWLNRIMYNLFVDRYRRRSYELGHEPLESHEPPAPEPEPRPIWKDIEASQVHRALAALEPPFRVVFELHFAERRSYREISARLGIPKGTVGTRLFRARQRLRRLLASPEAV